MDLSEPKLISPLLANHIMGDPISEHHGVRCCPAMLKDTEDKFIVKIISIPASQVQLDALLLSGAYASREDALKYFKELADATVEEARILQKLSKLEGFHAYPSWQIEPMDDGTGYDVYLLGEYNLTLERHLRRNALTHLAAVNLGLDLCAALSVCRRNGYLYVDLKPENIFITPNHEYRIGDLGFINLTSLKYASLPDKYRSAYTAPEITDAYSSLNTTLDVYALGLILYQAFNDGKLPEGGELLPPAYADYEMAEIILKACAVNPEDRWQDPQQMGQALVSYMQRNTVNDTPIIPVPVQEEEPEPEEPAPEEEPLPEEVEEESPIEEVPSEDPIEESPIVEEAVEEPAESEPEVEEEAEEDPEIPTEEEVSEDPDDLEQFIIDGFDTDETVPSDDDTQELAAAAVSDEVNEMLAQADELIAHEAPAPAVAPEPVEIPMPEPIKPEPEPESAEETEETPVEEADPGDEDEEEEADESGIPSTIPVPKRKMRGLIGILAAILITLLLAVGAFYYYENYYIQHLYDIDIQAAEDHMTVLLDTQTDNSLLKVTLTDTYGNSLHQTVENNRAEFTSLSSGTTYKITVTIDGFHKLIGNTTASYTTATQTNIVSFTSIAGDSDGSVILNFSVQGPDNTNWFVKYSTEGEEERTALCTGHMATITGLTVGSTYTFRLVPEAELYVVGNDTMEYTATPVIYAEDLSINGFDSGCLLVSWSAPEGITVESWTVRCYNADGFDTTFTVTEPQATIEVPDVTLGYTVDVKAQNMSVSKWVSVSAGSITFKDLQFDAATPGQLTVTWDYEGNAPEGGWMLMYTVDGSEKYIIQSETNSCTISPIVPGGVYSLSFVLADDITVFGGSATYTAPAAESFNKYGATADKFSFTFCPTPEEAGWIWYDVWTGYYTDTFTSGEKASLIVYMDATHEKSTDEIPTLFIVKNSDGVPVSIAEGRTRTWKAMWTQRHTELDLPVTPTTPGSYTVDIYFANQYAGTVPFTIVAEETESE